MTHDPYQTYPTFGAYAGLTNPFSSPYQTMQTSGINPGAGCNPLAAQQLGLHGIQGPPNYAQQLQLAAALASQAGIPQIAGQLPIGNPWQNPLIAAGLQNPFFAAALQMQNPLSNPMQAQFSSPYGVPFQQPHQSQGHPGVGSQISPFAQFNSPLAPQSWVGQSQIGGNPVYGQVNPLLAQLAARVLQGVNPWGAF